jgi:fimbrial chaperone protein
VIRPTLISVLASVAAFGLSPTRVVAGTFSITPLRVELSAGAETGVVTLRNQEDEPIVVQAEVHLWQQADGSDVLMPTRDVLVAPAVFTVPPNGAQMVRLALRREPDADRELSYRLVLTEVPQQTPGVTGLNFALQVSLPAFVAARQKTAPDLRWSAERRDDGALVLTGHNAGTEHARVLDLQVAPIEATGTPYRPTGAVYVLPGQSRQWTMTDDEPTNQNDRATWRRLRVKGTAEHGDFSAELTVAPE